MVALLAQHPRAGSVGPGLPRRETPEVMPRRDNTIPTPVVVVELAPPVVPPRQPLVGLVVPDAFQR